MSNDTILQWLEEYCPNKIPTTRLSEWEYGVLAGQRMVVEYLKIKLKIEGPITDEIK